MGRNWNGTPGRVVGIEKEIKGGKTPEVTTKYRAPGKTTIKVKIIRRT